MAHTSFSPQVLVQGCEGDTITDSATLRCNMKGIYMTYCTYGCLQSVDRIGLLHGALDWNTGTVNH